MRKSFQIQMLVSIIVMSWFLCSGCVDAKEPSEDGEPQQPVVEGTAATAPSVVHPHEAYHHRARPNYIPQQLREQWHLAALEGMMRTTDNARQRIFFTTKSEREKKESFSLEDTRDGYMVNGKAIPVPSRYMRQLPVQYERGIAYATTEFIALIEDTAKKMQKRFPGTIMYLGNFNLAEGGDISYSVSHNSGRDGDIAFYLKDNKDKFAHPDQLYKINRRFQSRDADGKYIFDLEKNAVLIETLIMQNKYPVQFIFVAKFLRNALRKELEKRENAEELLMRFDAIVMPLDSHDDHFHIRIYCSDDDICAGCKDKSVIHEWHKDPEPKREACISNHIKKINSKKTTPEELAASLQRLSILEASPRVEKQIYKFMDDDNVDVRTAAAIAAATAGSNATKYISERLKIETDLGVQIALLDSLFKNDSEAAVATFCDLLDHHYDDLMKEEITRRITKHIIHYPRAIYAQHLLVALDQQLPAPIKSELLLAFEVVTNHVIVISNNNESTVVAQKIDNYKDWYEKNSAKNRNQWLIEGFKKDGLKVTSLQVSDVPILLDGVVSTNRAVSVNAQLILKQLSKLSQDSLEWSEADALWHYTRYFKRHAKKLKIDLSDRDEHGNKIIKK